MPLAPMLAERGRLADIPAIGANTLWALEPKIDGERRLVEVSSGRVRGFNRDGNRTSVPKAVSAVLSKLPDCIVDGELVGDTYVLFDILMVCGAPLLDEPWKKRRAALTKLCKLHKIRKTGPVQLITAARTKPQKAALIRRVREARSEGFVAKLVDSTYKPDDGGKRPTDWLKLKIVKTVDCVITAGGVEKQNFSLAVYRDEKLVDVGEVSRLTGDGPTLAFEAMIAGLLRLLGHDVPPPVCEVTVLYASKNGRLIQPVKPKRRTDKRPAACHWDQVEAAVPLRAVI